MLAKLQEWFTIKYLGLVVFSLCMHIKRDRQRHHISINQCDYTGRVLEMENYNR